METDSEKLSKSEWRRFCCGPIDTLADKSKLTFLGVVTAKYHTLDMKPPMNGAFLMEGTHGNIPMQRRDYNSFTWHEALQGTLEEFNCYFAEMQRIPSENPKLVFMGDLYVETSKHK